MFNSDPTQDPASTRTTRRAFLAGTAAVAVTATLLKLRQPPGVEASTEIHGTPGSVTIIIFSPEGTSLGPQTLPKLLKTDGAWRTQLGANSFNIARQADTEMPYSGVSLNEHARGIFRCVCCQTALFSSTTKFDSGTGWPSFWAPIAKENITTLTDSTLGMARTEVRCTLCEAHLGHVFPDGPDPTGLRFCMNSASLHFLKA